MVLTCICSFGGSGQQWRIGLVLVMIYDSVEKLRKALAP